MFKKNKNSRYDEFYDLAFKDVTINNVSNIKFLLTKLKSKIVSKKDSTKCLKLGKNDFNSNSIKEQTDLKPLLLNSRIILYASCLKNPDGGLGIQISLHIHI